MRTRVLAVPAVFSLALVLSGCNAPMGPSVPMEAAKDAADPACAEVMVRLPLELEGMPKRATNAQATTAYGSPAAVLVRCGVETPPPTTDRCLSVNGVDWVENDREAPMYVYTTYGRTPAVEVVIDSTQASGSVLAGISSQMTYLPQTGACIGAEDLEIEDGTVAPATPGASEAPVQEPSGP